MKKIIATAALAAMLAGCSLTGTKTGTKTTNYGHDGQVSSVVEDVAVGDPNTEYYGAVKEISRNSAGVVKAQADAIKEMVKPTAGESVDAAAWKAAFGAYAVANIKDATAETIRAVVKATTGYDIGLEGVKVFRELISVGVPWVAAARMVSKMANQTGDKTEVAINGDGNQYTSSKTHINNEVNANVGDESNPSITGTPNGTAGSPTSTETVTEMAPEVAPASAGE